MSRFSLGQGKAQRRGKYLTFSCGGRTTSLGNYSNSNVRNLEPLDAVRCLAVGMNRFPNHAITSAGICKPQSFSTLIPSVSRRRFQPRSKVNTLVCVEGGRFRAVASIRPRSGPKSWEVSHLYADPDSDGAMMDLLEQVGVASAYGGAERVFLRVEADSNVIPAARRAGFFPCFGETLYREQGSAAELGRGLFDMDSHSVKRRSEHDHALFRLYNETTPVKVRQLTGMTLEQWKDSREPMGRRSRERVLELEGDVRGWIGNSVRSGVGRVELTLHPDCAALTPDIVEFGLRSLVKAKSVVAVVPDYVPLLGGALEERGFRPEDEFAVLVKSMARMARQPMAARTSLVAE